MNNKNIAQSVKDRLLRIARKLDTDFVVRNKINIKDLEKTGFKYENIIFN